MTEGVPWGGVCHLAAAAAANSMAMASALLSIDIFIAIPYSVCFIQPRNMRITIAASAARRIPRRFPSWKLQQTIAKMEANVYYLRQPVIGGADRCDAASSCTTV